MVAAAPTPGSWPPVCWPAGWADNGYKTPFHCRSLKRCLQENLSQQLQIKGTV